LKSVDGHLLKKAISPGRLLADVGSISLVFNIHLHIAIADYYSRSLSPASALNSEGRNGILLGLKNAQILLEAQHHGSTFWKGALSQPPTPLHAAEPDAAWTSPKGDLVHSQHA
jgi:hypothetical protein